MCGYISHLYVDVNNSPCPNSNDGLLLMTVLSRLATVCCLNQIVFKEAIRMDLSLLLVLLYQLAG